MELPEICAVRGRIPLRSSNIASKHRASARNVMSPATHARNHRRDRRRVVLATRFLLVSNPVDPRLGPNDPIIFMNCIRGKDSPRQFVARDLLGFIR